LRLSSRGFDVTQATLSRDIKELGLLKRSSDGAYQPSGVDSTSQASALDTLGRALSEYLVNIEPVQQLVVLKTGAGQAQLLGLAIDRSRLPEVAGTLAGDDTILIIARDRQERAGGGQAVEGPRHLKPYRRTCIFRRRAFNRRHCLARRSASR
jgi:transcriptional regulator of arginine metabolism